MSKRHPICVVLFTCVTLSGQSQASPPQRHKNESTPVELISSGRNACAFQVVDDHAGVELGEYGDQLVEAVRKRWYPSVAALAPLDRPSTTVIEFILKQAGEIGKIKVVDSSHDKSLDTAALKAIEEAAPFRSGIPNFPNQPVKLRFYFDYNRKPNQHRPFCSEAPTGVYRVGGSVTAPRVVYQPDPEYSEEARRKKRQGAVTLRLIVGTDGSASDVCVLKAAGSGLDEKAVEAVRAWRFAPGTKDGAPVPVLVSVDTSFHLY